ncbi:MAG: insulinase family protein [Chitinophagales bacterium]|nr:insulinase family protein [Chitinophagales bacterium]
MTSQPSTVSFQTIKNDPLKVQQYTLSNGLKLFLSVNENEPRIFTNIVVRAGSKQDPSDTTGLAHYMEHMLFKGTSKIGALDWEQEAELLEQIAALYEKHRQTDDESEREHIYKKIDHLSFEAAKLVAPNEYDKLVSSIGGKDTNAYTWVEQTVYVNDIPSNELERWMHLESERFRMMALRLFHTELETVYEEFNIGQDQDFRKVNKAIRKVLFSNHPYGTQTTIGAAKHLKNPSHRKIQEYFQTYYVPNNMGIILSGNFEPKQAVALAEQYFGTYKAKLFPPFSAEPQPALTEPVHVDVYGQQAAFVDVAWRLGGADTEDAMLAVLIKQMLYNQQAGLLDINLNQQQKVLSSQVWLWTYEDYTVLGLYSKPREGQTMEEARALLLEEVQKLREGTFDDWLIEAAIKDLKLADVKSSESNQSRVNLMTQAFIKGISWERMLNRFENWKKLKKEDIVNFARQHLKADNYVSVFKYQGEDTDVIKVDKPPITPVELKRDAVSAFAKSFLQIPVQNLVPKFADFPSKIHRAEIQKGLPFDYVYNPDNELFRLDYIFEMGRIHDRWLPIAIRYLPYLGTSKYSAAELQRAFFRLGVSFDLHTDDRRSYLTISGLDESMPEALLLMEHLLADLQADEEPLGRIISDILTRRQHVKQDRSFILKRAMANYARYGAQSPYQYRLEANVLQQASSELLIDKISNLSGFEHTIHYYGQRTQKEVQSLLEKHHRRPAHLKPIPAAASFTQLPTEKDEVLLVDFPMVQSDVMLISRGTPQFSLKEHLMSELYNEYFGYGLSSIVFQEIRESKALAYSTFAYYSSPSLQHQAHYLQAYLGTQPDKLSDAIPALNNIIQNMPLAPGQLEHARQSILRRIESEYIPDSRLYWESRAIHRLGFEHDLRADLYQHMDSTNAQQLIDFHAEHVKGRHFKYLLLGRKKDMDQSLLNKIGEVRELSLEEVFGY